MARSKYSFCIIVLYIISPIFSQSNYLPLNVGNRWNYANTDTNMTPLPWVVFDTVSIDGNSYFKFGHWANDPNMYYFRWNTLNTLSNYFLYFQYEYNWFDFSTTEGDTFFALDDIGDTLYYATVISDDDTVICAAGTFINCKRIYFNSPDWWEYYLHNWYAPDVGIVKFEEPMFNPFLLISAKIDDQTISSNMKYFISTDTTYYNIVDTIHWNVVVKNMGSDTIQFQGVGTKFYRWSLYDSAGNYSDGSIIPGPPHTTFSIPPNDSITDYFSTRYEDHSSYFPTGNYFGQIKPYYNYDSIPFDTVQFFLQSTTIQVDTENSPHRFSLHQNYPNPFNPTTTIQYELHQRSDVQITIYDLLGREVNTLVSETQDAGYKSVQWNASNVSSGMYFYQIKAGEYVQTRKMVLLK